MIERAFQAFRNWASEVFGFVLREEYELVQNQRWQSEREVRIYEERNRALYQEIHELLDRAYDGLRPFERYVDSAEVEVFRHYDINLGHVAWRYEVRLDNQRFASMHDPRKVMKRVREYAVRQITEKFRNHVAEKLFGLQVLRESEAYQHSMDVIGPRANL